jgi:uracil-DNA glycosylase
MRDILGEGWYEKLGDEFSKKYMLDLSTYITHERNTKDVFPKRQDVFNAYKFTPYEQVRVVILGQDPYFNPNEAHGLSFSVLEGLKTPPSLRIIFKAIEETIYNGLRLDQPTNLSRWTTQGVFLLNRILTVEKGKPLSHKDLGWETFTLKTIESLNDSKNTICYLLMGNVAQSIEPFIDTKHIVFKTEHPAASAYAGRAWNHNDVFNKINAYHKIEW